MADTPITLPKQRFTPLTLPERSFGFTHKWTIRYSDINFGAGATDTVTVTLGLTPGKFIVAQAMANVTTAFAGSGGLSMQVGATVPDFALAATSVLAAGPIKPANGINTVNTPASNSGIVAQTLKVIFTNSVSGSPSALTAGEVDLYLCIVDTTNIG